MNPTVLKFKQKKFYCGVAYVKIAKYNPQDRVLHRICGAEFL
jgi:hypothetical protein